MMLESTKKPFGSIAWAIDCCRKELEAALLLSTDRKAACVYAKSVYKTDCRGMYAHVQKEAKKGLKLAEQYGLTLGKPYFLDEQNNICGLHGDRIVPYRHCGRRDAW